MSYGQPSKSFGEQRFLSVGELTVRVKSLLESEFAEVWVAGEIADLARPRSGHCYLTLKDEQAQLPAVIWRSTGARLRFDLHDGLEVLCHGSLTVYPPHGRYQLVIQEIHPKGIGALELALRQLHARLAAEGLFAPERKRPLPRFARRIAVVTSPSGAALRDFLEVLRRRWRGADVLVLPVRVQGEGTADEIAAAIGLANRFAEPVDCLVVTRGGGSLEDLWAFNEEIVVRAIHGSRVPVVSAIGHEIDVTLSDLVADVRALTPSEAAELVVPAAEEMTALLEQYRNRMAGALRARISAGRARLEALGSRAVMRRPYQRIQESARRLDELEQRMLRGLRQRVGQARQQTQALADRLETLCPLAVLGRGYSLTQRADGRVVRDAAELSLGEPLLTRFARGQAVSRVESTRAESGVTNDLPANSEPGA